MSNSPSIRSFTLDFPGGPKTVALGHGSIGQWFLITVNRPPPEDDYEPSEWMNLTVVVRADPHPAPSPAGNPVFSLKNYSENEGILRKLEAIGVVKATGVVYPQGYVQIPLVEVLLPSSEWIYHCGKCAIWEDLGKPRFQRCSKCKVTYYCSRECQQEHWSEHKTDCKLLARGDYLGALNKQQEERNSYLQEMGFTLPS